jgi:hypothetical protein
MEPDDLSPDRPEQPAPPGVVGGRSRRRLEERALREHWPMPRTDRVRIVARLVALATDENSKPRVVMGASRALLQAASLNLHGVSVATAARFSEQLEGRLAELERMVSEQHNGDNT